MDHYLDIRLLPDPEFPATVLMSALFAKLHRGLVALGTRRIGVSFPDLVEGPERSLGGLLRLHGDADELARLMALPWLGGMRDFTRIGPVRPVPRRILGYRVVCRVQAKSSPERLRRRWMRRKGLSAEEARQAIPDEVAERLDLPFVTLTSQSTGQRFRLFIQHGQLRESPVLGHFNSYGLSPSESSLPHGQLRDKKIATIPWFLPFF